MDFPRGSEALCFPSPKPNCLKGLQTRVQHLLAYIPSPIHIRGEEGLTLDILTSPLPQDVPGNPQNISSTPNTHSLFPA